MKKRNLRDEAMGESDSCTEGLAKSGPPSSEPYGGQGRWGSGIGDASGGRLGCRLGSRRAARLHPSAGLETCGTTVGMRMVGGMNGIRGFKYIDKNYGISGMTSL